MFGSQAAENSWRLELCSTPVTPRPLSRCGGEEKRKPTCSDTVSGKRNALQIQRLRLCSYQQYCRLIVELVELLDSLQAFDGVVSESGLVFDPLADALLRGNSVGFHFHYAARAIGDQ